MTAKEYNKEFLPKIEKASCFVKLIESSIDHASIEDENKAEVKRQLVIRGWDNETKSILLNALECYKKVEGLDKLENTPTVDVGEIFEEFKEILLRLIYLGADANYHVRRMRASELNLLIDKFSELQTKHRKECEK